MNKILIVGPEYFEINNSVAYAFDRLGHEVRIFNFCETYPVTKLTRITHGLFSKLGFTKFVDEYDKKINSDLLDIYYKYKPNLVVIIKGHKIFKETLYQMREAKLILWMMDSIVRVPQIYNSINQYDRVFVFEEDDVDILRKRKISAIHLPLALDTNKYKPKQGNNKIYDVAFVGSLYQERIDILKKIIDYFPKSNIIIYGFFPSWKVNLKNIFLGMSKYRKQFRIKPLPANEIESLYAKSKIILNLHMNFSLSGCNLRFFEIAGTKNTQIVNKKSLIIEGYGNDVLTFENYDELIKLIRKILNGEIDTAPINNSIYEKTLKDHTFENRVSKILEYIEK